MNCLVCLLALMLCAFHSRALASHIPSCPAARNFRQQAAGNVKNISREFCHNDRHNKKKTHRKQSHDTKRKVKKVPQITAKIKEEIVSLVERLFASNRTSSNEGVYELHLLPNSSANGAVCLDGSPPGFYLRNGTSLEKSKWIIFFQGGAWCDDEDSCYQRSYTALGSSTCFGDYLQDEECEGLLSSHVKHNPEFYNWSSVFVPYCDGASFTGDREKPLEFNDKLLYFRGRRILDALLDEFLRRGMDKASEIILSGSSAGALSAMVHSDYIRTRVRRLSNASVRVLADAGFFLDEPSFDGDKTMRHIFQQTYTLHNSSAGLNHKCLQAQKRKRKYRCFFPQYSLPFVTTPVFLVNSLYDSWQIGSLSNISCICDFDTCSSAEKSFIEKFRKKTLRALRSVFDSKETAVFADACLVHSQCPVNDFWSKVQVGNVTIAQAFVNWYHGEVEDRFKIDDPYPSNLTC